MRRRVELKAFAAAYAAYGELLIARERFRADPTLGRFQAVGAANEVLEAIFTAETPPGWVSVLYDVRETRGMILIEPEVPLYDETESTNPLEAVQVWHGLLKPPAETGPQMLTREQIEEELEHATMRYTALREKQAHTGQNGCYLDGYTEALDDVLHGVRESEKEDSGGDR